jgi:hypothetical protein
VLSLPIEPDDPERIATAVLAYSATETGLRVFPR